MTLVLSTSPGFGRHGSVPERLAETGWELVRCLDRATIKAITITQFDGQNWEQHGAGLSKLSND